MDNLIVTAINLRLAQLQDEPFLWQILACASHEDEIETVKSNPQLSIYVENWGRKGDMGFIAIYQNQVISAAWV
jgi:hypothetical protein